MYMCVVLYIKMFSVLLKQMSVCHVSRVFRARCYTETGYSKKRTDMLVDIVVDSMFKRHCHCPTRSVCDIARLVVNHDTLRWFNSVRLHQMSHQTLFGTGSCDVGDVVDTRDKRRETRLPQERVDNIASVERDHVDRHAVLAEIVKQTGHARSPTRPSHHTRHLCRVEHPGLVVCDREIEVHREYTHVRSDARVVYSTVRASVGKQRVTCACVFLFISGCSNNKQNITVPVVDGAYEASAVKTFSAFANLVLALPSASFMRPAAEYNEIQLSNKGRHSSTEALSVCENTHVDALPQSSISCSMWTALQNKCFGHLM